MNDSIKVFQLEEYKIMRDGIKFLLSKDGNISVICFFFSSRRRHTRFDCDWSSDVCSSDLTANGSAARQHARMLGGLERWRARTELVHFLPELVRVDVLEHGAEKLLQHRVGAALHLFRFPHCSLEGSLEDVRVRGGRDVRELECRRKVHVCSLLR